MNSPERIWNQPFINRWKNWIILSLIVLVVAMIAFRKRPPVIPAIDDRPVLAKVDLLKDENDKLYAKIAELSISNSLARAYSDSLGKALKIKPKFIKGVSQQTTIHDTIFVDSSVHVTQPTPQDSSWSISKKDEWINIEAKRLPNGHGTIRFSSRDTLTRVEVVKKSLFKRTERYEIIRNASPYNQLDKAYNWKTKETKTWLVVGPSVGYDPINNKVIYGVTATLPILQFKR